MRRTGARLLIGFVLAAAGGGTAALLPGGAGAASQASCATPTSSVPGDPGSCLPEPTTTTSTVPPTETTPPPTTTTTPTETTTTETTTTETTPIPTITVPEGGTGSVQRPPPKPRGNGVTPTPTQTTTQTSPVAAAPAPLLSAGPTAKQPPLGAGSYYFPVYGPVSWTDTYGIRWGARWHHGDDIFAPLGAPVVAVADGTLYSVGFNDLGGNRLWLRDTQGNYFYYASLSAFSTQAVQGSQVKAGTVLGFVGDTGAARGTPPHLAFEVHPAALLAQGYDGAVNPTPYLRSWQQLQRLRLSSTDLLLTTASGWSAAVAAPRPAPAAVLVNSSDISSATTLNRRSVRKALAVQVAPARTWAFHQAIARHRPAPLIDLSAKERRQAARAESLDQGASLPFGFPGGTVWDSLAECEAGGDWTANTGNGFYGGLQFTASTWRDNGGGRYARYANFASRQEQIVIAQRVLANQGWVAWPVCSLKLGLR